MCHMQIEARSAEPNPKDTFKKFADFVLYSAIINRQMRERILGK